MEGHVGQQRVSNNTTAPEKRIHYHHTSVLCVLSSMTAAACTSERDGFKGQSPFVCIVTYFSSAYCWKQLSQDIRMENLNSQRYLSI
jgi:hypothetical protein